VFPTCVHQDTRTRETPERYLSAAFQKVWNVYHAVDAATFRLQATELLTWAETNTTGYVLERSAEALFKSGSLYIGL